MSIDTIALVMTLALGFLGIWYQLRAGQKDPRDDMREQHKETMSLLHNVDKNLGIVADRTLRESYPPPHQTRP